MSENEVGIIGQLYEDRKTKKKGVLVGRDTVRKTLVFEGDNNKQFIISNSSFRSNYRKVSVRVDEEGDDGYVAPELTDEEKSLPDVEVEEKEPISLEETDESELMAKLAEKRADSVSTVTRGDNVEECVVDGVLCFRIEDKGEVRHIEMLPDIYVYSCIYPLLDVSTIAFDTSKHTSVSADTILSIEEINSALTEATAEVNLYGYITETGDVDDGE